MGGARDGDEAELNIDPFWPWLGGLVAAGIVAGAYRLGAPDELAAFWRVVEPVIPGIIMAWAGVTFGPILGAVLSAIFSRQKP